MTNRKNKSEHRGLSKIKALLAAIFAKKIVSVAVVLVLALTTGYCVGRIYVAGLEPVLKINASEEELRQSEEEVENLVQKSKTSKPTNFTALEAYLVAEYNLNHAESFYKIMTGTVVAMGIVNQNMKCEKIKLGDYYIYSKMSPSSLSVSNICSQVVFNQKTGDIKINNNGSFTSANGFDISADFKEENFKHYTREEYKQIYNTNPENVMPYIISSATCSQNKFSPVVENNNGTFSFSIAIDGAQLALAALCYSYDIKFSSNLTNPPDWISLNMDVTVDENFNFVSVGYKEVYKMSYQFLNPTVTDTFLDVFHFEQENIPTLQQVAGREVI